MAQELDAQPGAVRRPFDEARDVGDDPAVHDVAAEAVQAHHAQLGFQGGEGVVRDLGTGGAQAAHQGALSRVGEAHQAHVCDELQLQIERALFAFLTGLVVAGRAVGGALEVGVPEATAATTGHADFLAVGEQLRQHLTGVAVLDHRAQGHLQPDVQSILAVAHAAFALASPVGGEITLAAIGVEGVQGPVGPEEHRPALATVAAIGPALGGELLPAEAHGARTPVTGGNAELDLVKKHVWALGEE